MKQGMLWFDNNRDRTLTEKISGAAAYYERKFGAAPTVCYLHPSMTLGITAATLMAGVTLRASNQVLPHHFWLGMDENVAQRPQEPF